MRDFDWGFRATHILGGIVEALIILVSVAVLAGLVFLLVRYLLVATRAAQLYVNEHDTNRVPPVAGMTPSAPSTPPAAPAPSPAPSSAATPGTASSTDTASGTAPTKPQPAAKRPTKPKTPPTA